eukprot:629577-Alexandrium_andersonii.AAC.1
MRHACASPSTASTNPDACKQDTATANRVSGTTHKALSAGQPGKHDWDTNVLSTSETSPMCAPCCCSASPPNARGARKK